MNEIRKKNKEKIQELISCLQSDGYLLYGRYNMKWKRWHDLENSIEKFYCENCKQEIMNDDVVNGFKSPFLHEECDSSVIPSLLQMINKKLKNGNKLA
jgi:hypothetical protein